MAVKSAPPISQLTKEGLSRIETMRSNGWDIEATVDRQGSPTVFRASTGEVLYPFGNSLTRLAEWLNTIECAVLIQPKRKE